MVRTHRFNGTRFYIHLDALDGWCDRPRKPDAKEYPCISLPNGLPCGNDRRAKTGLINIIHESLHAEDWDMPEAKVDRISREIGNLLWRLNYRRKNG